MEEKIDQILLANFKEGDWQEARKQLLLLFSVSGSLPLADLFDEIEGIIWLDSKTQRMKFDDIKRKWVGRQ